MNVSLDGVDVFAFNAWVWKHNQLVGGRKSLGLQSSSSKGTIYMFAIGSSLCLVFFLGEQKVNLLTDGNQVFLFPLNCVIVIFYTVVLYFIATVLHIFLTNSNIHVLYFNFKRYGFLPHSFKELFRWL